MKKRITLINFSDENYSSAQKLNKKTALRIGGFEKVISYSPKDIDSGFYNKNQHILNQKRGGGYWLWKPYFIKKTLEQLDWGDYLFYSDSGSYFIASIDTILSSIDSSQEIIPFELQHVERQWTKRDCFVMLGCDEAEFVNSKQQMATFSLWKKSEFSMKFINEWLLYAQDERLLTDVPNQSVLPNYDEFIEHRHDQSIFSLLSKKYKIKVHRDPSQFGNEFIHLYPNSSYPQVLVSTREKNSTFFESLKKKIRSRTNSKIYSYLRNIKKTF